MNNINGLKTKNPKNLAVQVTIDVPLNDLADLMCSAFEGGSAYWASAKEFIEPKQWDIASYPDRESGYSHEYPFNEGGAVIIEDEEEGEGKTYRLDLEAIQRGTQVMATKFPRHWGDFMQENYDATTGDVFLQCCIFSDIIYG